MKPEVASSATSTTNVPKDPPANAVELFRRAFQGIRPRSAVPPIEVRFSRFANANCFIQLKHGAVEVRISDVLESAPGEVIESLAYILISKLYRRPVPKEHALRYRRHLAKKSVSATIADVRQQRGRKEIAAPRGGHYDLIEIFEEVNFRYFHGLMARPNLGWSLRTSRQTLGHYDASHHTIVINRVLDSHSVPRLAVQFVMYHEMLHVRHPTELRGTRRCVHTKTFQTAEQLFEGFAEAKQMLRQVG